MEIKKYITENEPKMLEDLFSLIRIPSISAKPEHHDDMLACAERWAQLLLEAGADEALVMPSKGNPIVFGQKIVDPDARPYWYMPLRRDASRTSRTLEKRPL